MNVDLHLQNIRRGFGTSQSTCCNINAWLYYFLFFIGKISCFCSYSGGLQHNNYKSSATSMYERYTGRAHVSDVLSVASAVHELRGHL